MSVYPYDLDDDTTIIRVDDNVTEISGQNFNQVRDAVFRIEEELGIKPAGTKNDLKEFLVVAHNEDGSIRASALASVGLVTLPIDNADVGINAGILESKLNLDFNTSDLHQLILANSNLINALIAVTDNLTVRINSHIAGAGGISSLRHVLSHIDVNQVPFDIRDPQYQSPSGWTGIRDTDGNLRTGTDLATVLQQINDELVDHQNALEEAHPASAISVDTSAFVEISREATDVQSALNSLDNIEEERFGIHRAIMHSAGVPVDARSQVIKKLGDDGEVDIYADGYGETVVSSRSVETFVAAFPGTAPVDDVVNGDNVIRFIPPTDPAERLILDSQFSQVRIGDIIRVNYGDGIEAQFFIESLRYIPGSSYFVRVNSNNLLDVENARARIDRPQYDPNVYGIAVAAACNATPVGNFPGFYSSITLADPRCASVLGIGFDGNQINSNHYNLYLQLYPNGNPADEVITLPAIDVTGNAGVTPGAYTLDKIVLETNNAFREAGYNFRFLAFQFAGNFGIALADPFDGAAFSIVNGNWSSGTGQQGIFTQNVIGNFSPDGLGHDGLGLGDATGGHASPAYRNSFVDTIDAQRPTKIFHPRKNRFYVSNGSRRDFLRSAVGVFDEYWLATITQKTETINSFETSYTIDGEILNNVGLERGKTITVLPTIEPTNSLYNKADYGRFIIKNVIYQPGCPGDCDKTIITVINSVHASSIAKGMSSDTSFTEPVRIYFGNDTVGFDLNHMIDGSTPSAQDYHRYHEIFVNKDAKTFSHERVRMPIQSATGTVLGTDNWHIVDVSPKFRGYPELGSTSFSRFVRLKILSYDAVSGEFTARIGQRPNPPTAGLDPLNPGQITTGRKGVPVRLYDNSGNDWIELLFSEESTVPSIINVNTTVDIEIFESLSLNEEVLLLATCELNWDSEDNLLVSSVTDKRQIGSISEKEFTQSAKSFITAGDKALHTNGVILGFENFDEDPSDSAAIIIGGGTAIIDGNIVNANISKVKIPELVPTGSGSGTSVDWAICLDVNGNFITIPLTIAKDQYFAEAGTGGGTPYFIPSATFSEIVNERSDLLILYVVTVTIASVTINSIDDVRKYAFKESGNITFSISDDSALGSFTNLQQLINWAERISEDKIYAQVRGNLTIDNTADFTNTVAGVVIDGGGGTITVNSQTGLIVKRNFEIKNLKIIYNFVVANNPDDLSILSSNHACIRMEQGTNGIRIERCEFLKETDGDRYPYIAGYSPIAPSQVGISNVLIDSNTFRNSSCIYGCAIGFRQVGTIGGSYTVSLLDNININNNIIEGFQSIIITGDNNVPLKTRQVKITKNTGRQFVIGVSGRKSNVSSGGPSPTEINSNIFISGNNCGIIYPAQVNGKFSENYITTANLIIENNELYQIYVSPNGNTYITNNILHADATISSVSESVIELDNTAKIKISGSGGANFKITGNQVEVGYLQTGIYLNSGFGIVSGNYLSRGATTTILAFIDAENLVDTSNVLITDNVMNSRSDAVVFGSTYVLKHDELATVFNNVNDVEDAYVSFAVGKIGTRNTLGIGEAVNDPNIFSWYDGLFISDRELLIKSTATSMTIGYAWMIPVALIIPRHAKIIGFTYQASWDQDGDVNPGMITRAKLVRSGDIANIDLWDTGDVNLLNENEIYNVELQITNPTYIGDSYIFVRIYPSNGFADDCNILLKNAKITYLF